MKTSRGICCLALVASVTVVPKLFASSTVETVNQLGWLTGCWESSNSQGGPDEIWTTAAGGSLFGISRTVRNGETVAYEFMEIRADGAGVIFVAYPSGQASTTFGMISIGPRHVTFENAAHDFPQRVGYRRLSQEKLLGFIEGETSLGKIKTIEFPLRNRKCDGPTQHVQR